MICCASAWNSALACLIVIGPHIAHLEMIRAADPARFSLLTRWMQSTSASTGHLCICHADLADCPLPAGSSPTKSPQSADLQLRGAPSGRFRFVSIGPQLSGVHSTTSTRPFEVVRRAPLRSR